MVLTPRPAAEIYRGPGYSHAELKAAALRELDDVIDHSPLVRVAAARRTRVALGIWLVACAALVPLASVLDEGEAGTNVVQWAWLGAPLVGLAAYARRWSTERRKLVTAASAALDRDRLTLESGARFRTREVLEALLSELGAGERRSVGWLLAGLALLAPLGLHVLAEPIIRDNFPYVVQPGRFTPWVRLSLLFTTHAHLVLAWRGWKHARRVAATPSAQGPRDPYGLGALGWTTLASAMPGLALYGIPPVLVLLTGLLFVPLAWRWTTRRVHAERSLLERASR